jgi:uncharacterized integral membrane protein
MDALANGYVLVMTSNEGGGNLPTAPPVRPDDAQWGPEPAYPTPPPSAPWATPPLPSPPPPGAGPPPVAPANGANGGPTAVPGTIGPQPTTPAHRSWPSRTRSSSAYAGIGVVLVILVVVLDFIVQNLKEASIHFFTVSFRFPIGVLVLGGAIAGGGCVLLVSLFRVIQLRRSARRQARV